MAYEFDFNEMFKWCAIYLSKGLRVVRLHGIWPDGRCTCGQAECAVGKTSERSCGKHPVESNWGDKYARSEDDILDWDDGTPFNIGIVLGPGGRKIDCEDDSPEGRAFRESLGLHTLVTPTYTSGRSTHQITDWDERLEGISKAQPGGLECRIGGAGAQIQSVLPPSWHWSGVKYQWKPGLSIDEVDVAKTPNELVLKIVSYSDGGAGAGGGGEYLGPLVFRVVKDGEGRHRSLLMWAWNKIINERNPLDPERRAIITREVQDANEKYIVPPKAPKEALKIINSSFAHFRRKYAEQNREPTASDLTLDAIESEIQKISDDSSSSDSCVATTGFAEHGLEPYKVGSITAYRPGNWSIQMIHSDPPEVILCVPAWERTPCRGRIQMTFDTFRSAAKVASTVFLATRRVILDGDSAKWAVAWKGMDSSKKTNNQSIPGIMEQLVQRKNAEDDIQVGTSSLRYAQLAAYVLQVFKKATQPKNEENPEPNESGRPCWVKPDELWFQWGKIWEDIGRTHDVAPGERNRVRGRLIDAMGVRDFEHRRHRFPSGRLEYVVFTPEWIEALERMASGDDSENWTVKGDVDSVFPKTENHSPSTVRDTEVVA